MTRSQVSKLLPRLPMMQRKLVFSLLDGPKTAVQLANLYCLSFSQQLGKARRWFGIPIESEPVEGKPYYLYRLVLDNEVKK